MSGQLVAGGAGLLKDVTQSIYKGIRSISTRDEGYNQ